MIVRTVSKWIGLMVVITVLLSNIALAQDHQAPEYPSPCPEIFDYAYSRNGYFGIITLRDASYGTTTVHVELTQPGILNSNYSGSLSLNVVGDRVPISPLTYRLDFPLPNVVPQVSEIIVNNVRICSGNLYYVPRTTIDLEHTLTFGTFVSPSAGPQRVRQPVIRVVRQLAWHSTQPGTPVFSANNVENSRNPPIFSDVLEPSRSRVQQPQIEQSRIQQQVPPTVPTPMPLYTASFQQLLEFNINSVCGQENTDVSQLSIKGVEISKSRFPWIVAIYTRNVSSLKFICGGSLISRQTVISSAHCFYEDLETIKPENLLLSMGRHSLNDWRNCVNVEVERLVLHPDYRPGLNNYDADVAIVQLKQVVVFSASVRPICLWQGPLDIPPVDGIRGVIAGWGEDETKGISSVPKLVNVNIVSELECIRSNVQFYYLTSNRTLCAGNRDGSGPCMGDSGNGLMVRNGNKWMLRGTVSASLVTSALQCNLDEYVVYSDIAKFLDWIRSNTLF